MRKAVTFNPHWVGEEPAWDIRLLNGDHHRSVTKTTILAVSTRRHGTSVLECDVQDYGTHHLKIAAQK
jgi:hypothetical protein